MVFAEIGIECVALHSMIAQRLRLAALAKFKSSQVKIMIATDVGSRYLCCCFSLYKAKNKLTFILCL